MKRNSLRVTMASNRDETHNGDDRSPLFGSSEHMAARADSTLTKEDGEQLPSQSPRPDQETTNSGRNQIQQNDEVGNGTNLNNDEAEHGRNQMTFVVLISIMLVLVAVTFSQSLSPFMIQKYSNSSPISQDVLIVYMLAGLLIIVAMFLCKHGITEPNTGNGEPGVRDKIKYILRENLSIVGMSFFFPFACILDLSHIIAAISCDETWRLCGDKFYSEYLLDLFFHLIRILFMGAELAFCCKFHGTRFKEKGIDRSGLYGLVRCGLMVVMAANLGLWFLSLVYETAERDSDQQSDGKKCSNESDHIPSHKMRENWQACVHETSSAHKVMHGMNRYLYPFAIEFSLLVGEFLVTKFVSGTQQKARGPVISTTIGGHQDFLRQSQAPENDLAVRPTQRQQTLGGDSDAPEGKVVGAQEPPTSSVDATVAKLGQLLSVFIIAIGLLASFLYISFAFIDSFADARNKTDINSVNWGYVYETYSMINYVLINVLLVAGYVCGCGLEIQARTIHGLDWLVLISAFGPFMRLLIAITAIAASYTDLSPADFPGILICNRLANLGQLILQTPFIFLSERWRLTERQRSQPRYRCQEKILKAIIFCLAVTNLVNWISDSIILTSSFSIRNVDLQANNWKIVERIAVPLLIFYRFNSFLLFTRAYLGD